MNTTSLTRVGEEQLDKARAASSGRAAVTVHGGHEHDLRQTLIALAEGRSLGEHKVPGDAALQVLVGRVRLSAGDDTWEGTAGDHVVIPAPPPRPRCPHRRRCCAAHCGDPSLIPRPGPPALQGRLPNVTRARQAGWHVATPRNRLVTARKAADPGLSKREKTMLVRHVSEG